MTNDTPQHNPTATPDAPRFPHQEAAPHGSREAAERQHAEPPGGVPRWQPEDGDFN